MKVSELFSPFLVIGVASLIIFFNTHDKNLKKKSFADGFDSGRAAVLAQMHNCISSNDSQWIETVDTYSHRINWDQKPVFTREYTNRFFTNWVLRVRQP